MITKTGLLNPNSVTWRTSDTVKDVLGCLLALVKVWEPGPFSLRFSFDWMGFLDKQYVNGAGEYIPDMSLKDVLSTRVNISEVVCDASLIVPLTAEFSKDGECVLRATFDRLDGG